jgi:hypothetical protein
VHLVLRCSTTTTSSSLLLRLFLLITYEQEKKLALELPSLPSSLLPPSTHSIPFLLFDCFLSCSTWFDVIDVGIGRMQEEMKRKRRKKRRSGEEERVVLYRRAAHEKTRKNKERPNLLPYKFFSNTEKRKRKRKKKVTIR